MGDLPADATAPTGVTVRYWAAAKAAAGVEADVLPVSGPTTLDVVFRRVLERHADRPRLADVVSVCSVVLGDRPVGARAPEDVAVNPGDVVELLPPFAGG
jgi:molybdopterin converting factor small subunit